MDSARDICCAYLYIISKYGYPPPVEHTTTHIAEMAALGFSSIELEGIGPSRIRFLYTHRQGIKEALERHGCQVPVLCLVLPQLSMDVAAETKAEMLEHFEMGCLVADYLGAEGVLDNGPLLPLQYPQELRVMRHYNGPGLNALLPVEPARWDGFWENLTDTYRKACKLAAKYGLDYHLHPCEGSLTATTDSFLQFMQAVGAPNLMFNLDTANQFLFRDNLPLSLVRLADRIGYIHISDSRGLQPEHLPPGSGQIQWDTFFSVLEQIGFQGRIAIDVGGAETPINDLDGAYRDSAQWLAQKLAGIRGQAI